MVQIVVEKCIEIKEMYCIASNNIKRYESIDYSLISCLQFRCYIEGYNPLSQKLYCITLMATISRLQSLIMLY